MAAPLAIALKKLGTMAAKKLAASVAGKAQPKKKKHGLGGGCGCGCLIVAVGALVAVMMMTMLFGGGAGGSASAAQCTDYREAANGGNTGPEAATNPIMPGKGMYTPSEAARNEIPPRMIMAAMRAAARYDGLDWTLIVGQMYQETKYGQDPSAAPGGSNSAGYKGILQFGDPAWQDYGDDGNDDGKKDLYNVDDAAFAAANYLHAEKAETQAAEALRIYSGSTTSNTIYMRVVLTQAARYRGSFTSDQDRIKRWYDHLKTTIKKNPDFPTLGQQSDIPEPVGNDVQISQARGIKPVEPRKWSTPALPEDGGSSRPSTVPAGFTTPRADGAGTPAMAPAAFSRPLARPEPPDPDGDSGKDWQWPLKEGTYREGTPYHKQGSHWSLGYHTGFDFEADPGVPIYAPADGTVKKAGAGGAYGNQTNIEHAGGVVTLYAHQTKISVSVGDKVTRGQQIGTVGSTGNVTGPHLHWEVRKPGVDDPFTPGQDEGPGMVDPKAWMEGKVVADPDYGTTPEDGGEDGESKDNRYADCAEQAGGPGVAPDGAGSTGVLPKADDPVIRQVLRWAQRGLGTKYVWGAPRLQGENPTSFDCSSFTQWAYYQASGGKINIGSTTRDQQPNLKAHEVKLSEAQPGDVIFFRPQSDGTSGHVGLVWDPAGKKIIHAPNKNEVVKFSTWDVQDEITGVYRVAIPKGTDPVEAGSPGDERAA
ncbi:peptidoglycan DD-metalloendopeptidase family protein [Streptomyces sp. NPDC057702]|uniref:peptidoglycan DD-metalloendopeptidase family protein n=1 Tax=unclassified Streptomyces TaxID=2593676 RepID=UPI0036CDD5A0